MSLWFCEKCGKNHPQPVLWCPDFHVTIPRAELEELVVVLEWAIANVAFPIVQMNDAVRKHHERYGNAKETAAKFRAKYLSK